MSEVLPALQEYIAAFRPLLLAECAALLLQRTDFEKPPYAQQGIAAAATEVIFSSTSTDQTELSTWLYTSLVPKSLACILSVFEMLLLIYDFYLSESCGDCKMCAILYIGRWLLGCELHFGRGRSEGFP
jgi:hypothetical protein